VSHGNQYYEGDPGNIKYLVAMNASITHSEIAGQRDIITAQTGGVVTGADIQGYRMPDLAVNTSYFTGTHNEMMRLILKR
jgi:hypothetical protein